MSSQFSYEENERLSQRACYLLTGCLPSATKVLFDDPDDEKEKNIIVLVPPGKVINNIAELVEEIFGVDDDNDIEEVDYYQQSERTLKYFETQCPRAVAIEAIRKIQRHRVGEDYGAGVACDNTDCYRDYNDDYFERVLVEEDIYQTLCPDCAPDENEEEHKDKRAKIVVNSV